ncbi:DNA recombinase [Lactobacillus helveticus]|nr:DNA recombinase [Lactobacillus helveticus]PTS35705.1 DNA recombinase [Lactobacillus helveticus]PTS38028.1 DNA recombinase [Lactobacillus helveticus]PTV20408.1 DNA recombinase [Lactobacillus helveticus]PTV32083.1 DNA recombinase [Lactobacillus helveticus]
MRQIVKPIKDSWVLRSVQESLLKDFDLGFRNYTIFRNCQIFCVNRFFS